MILASGDPRRVVPRWHSPEVSARRPDTHSLFSGNVQQAPLPDSTEIFRRAADFDAFPNDAHAGDLVSVALIARRPEIARKAAKWILASETASELMRRLASMITNPEVTNAQSVLAMSTDVSGTNPTVVARRIATLRRRLSLAPDDPMAWAELARQHTLAGHLTKAKDAMRVAITRAPNDRYLLRATARLYHHMGDFDRAHSLLVRAPRTPSDPWLIAAEIALAGASGQDPQFVRAGRRMLEGEVPPVHLSELASVLATLQLDAGHATHARRLFRRALIDPTENALAQAEWAAAQINLDVESQLRSVPSSWEARALAAVAAGDPGVTINEAWGWFYDQPFASGPAVFGSYHSAKHGKFSEGAKFAENGIAANPRSFLLRNNLAFCLAKTGKIVEAQQHINLIKDEHLDREQRATIEATRGLVAFRSGRTAEGASRYRNALNALTDKENRLLALINLAIETLRFDPFSGDLLARQSREEADRLGMRDEGTTWLTQLGSDARNAPN